MISLSFGIYSCRKRTLLFSCLPSNSSNWTGKRHVRPTGASGNSWKNAQLVLLKAKEILSRWRERWRESRFVNRQRKNVSAILLRLSQAINTFL